MLRTVLTCYVLLKLLQVPWALPVRSERLPFSPEDEELLYKFLSGSLEMELSEDPLEGGGGSSSKRTGRSETIMGVRHAHCSRPSESWSTVSGGSALLAQSVLYRVTITTASAEPPWKVFPLWHLMMFMKRFYSCCKLGYTCKRIKGYQGRLIGHNERKMEFFLRPEYLNLNVLRSQLNLHIANPDRLVLEAEIRVKMQSTTVAKTTRNITWHKYGESELAFDTLFLFKMMKEAHFKEGGGTTELSLILKCFQGSNPLSCSEHGVSVLRAPFMAIGYI
ncbi:uncharacterized protein si:ch211-170d8.2 [Carcharodon carcharias]|uniref:uncharacterized protein si:ch211-170d8.2 n=1 Tax=Carcharodon carcharias TaxID=13397 RepID=UPI001B7E01C3|nr:uncharacterized protein si:ch211-170d8.2 [Carcharodon carcharias]